MPISISELRASSILRKSQNYNNLNEALAAKSKTAFLCHSHHDRDLVFGVIKKLNDAGWNVYVDWLDETMPDHTNKTTAIKIQKKIVDSNYFLFLATANSKNSKWCPWEIGYADGKKPNETILIIPTQDAGVTHGNEYLGLYSRIDLAYDMDLITISPGESKGRPIRLL